MQFNFPCLGKKSNEQNHSNKPVPIQMNIEKILNCRSRKIKLTSQTVCILSNQNDTKIGYFLKIQVVRKVCKISNFTKFYRLNTLFICGYQRVQEKSQYVISLIKNITLRCVTLPASRHVFLKYKRGSFPVKTIFRTLKVALSKRKKGFLLFTHQEAVRIFRQMRKKHTRLSVIGIKYDRLSIHAHFSCLLLRRNKLVRI